MWLEGQLNDSDSLMNVIVSSIQVLDDESSHRIVGLFPGEEDRLLNVLRDVPIRV